jgi:RNA polymerase sigma factor (sigma-70 family)
MARGKKRREGLLAADLTLIEQDELDALADQWLAQAEAANEASAGKPQYVPGALSAGYAPSTETPSSQRMFVQQLQARIARRLPSDFGDPESEVSFEERLRIRGRALGILTPGEQRRLVDIARSYSGPGRERVREEATELLILTNIGYVERFIARHQARGLELDVLRQEARLAIFKAIDLFDQDNGASFLAFAEWQIRNAISEAIRRDSRLVRLKSRMSEVAVRVERELKWFEAQGYRANEVSDEMLAERTKDRLEQVKEVRHWVENGFLRLDAPVATKDGEVSIADAIADETADVSEEAEEEIFAEELARIVGRDGLSERDRQLFAQRFGVAGDEELERLIEAKTLSAYERTLLTLYYNLDDDVDLKQKDLYDGVYVATREVVFDGETYPAGTEFSAEQSVISDRRARAARNDPKGGKGAIVTSRQTELNQLWASGNLSFVPGTDAARKLMELSGVPPTSATVQAQIANIHAKLAKDPRLEGVVDSLLSRGRNALEHSETACEMTREMLLGIAMANGDVLDDGRGRKLSLDDIESLRAGEPSRSAPSGVAKKGKLREVAELYGLVDSEDGRLLFDKEDVATLRRTPVSASMVATLAPEVEAPAPPPPEKKPSKKTPNLKVIDLLQTGYLRAGETISLYYKGDDYYATVREDGRIVLEDGRVFASLSGAAQAAKGTGADPGWNSWRVERDGELIALRSLREKAAEVLRAKGVDV